MFGAVVVVRGRLACSAPETGLDRVPKLTFCRHGVVSQAVAQGIQLGKTMISYGARRQVEALLRLV